VTATASDSPGPRPRALRAILWGGFLAGTLDLIFAFFFYGAHGSSPERILQSVASGWLGKAAFAQGFSSASLGLASQFMISTGAAAVYFLASRRLPVLADRAVVAGILYGAGIYAFMNLVVVPLSAAPFKPSRALPMLLPALAAHMFIIGLPIALAVRRYSARSDSSSGS
jgi:hypothetical protein